MVTNMFLVVHSRSNLDPVKCVLFTNKTFMRNLQFISFISPTHFSSILFFVSTLSLCLILLLSSYLSISFFFLSPIFQQFSCVFSLSLSLSLSLKFFILFLLLLLSRLILSFSALVNSQKFFFLPFFFLFFAITLWPWWIFFSLFPSLFDYDLTE